MTLVWGLRDKGRSQEPEKEERAQLLLRQLDDEEADVLIAAVTVAELLTPLKDREQATFLAELNRQFRVAPFDLSATALAADLYRLSKESEDPHSRPARRVLRADTLIVASLKMAGATTFYSHDRSCRKMAERAGMAAHDLPTHSEKLFK